MSDNLSDTLLKMSLNENYVMVAAIDFGTTFSGYAFSFKSDMNKILMNRSWGQGVGFQSYKTPTCVLVNSKNQFVAFGYVAENRYAEKDIDDPEEYDLYRQFKMLLHSSGKLTRESTITSVNGKTAKALDVFAMALKFLKEHLTSAVSQQIKGSVDESMIRWVITVPAIWSEEAKQFMREAAFQGELIKAKDSRQLVIALEPEAASVFCRSLELTHFLGISESEAQPSFNVGCKYLVVDAGGGTVDLTAHEVLYNGKVKEIHSASGGAWGGTKVDDNFVKLLEDVMGSNFISSFRQECSQPWLHFMVNFEKAKRLAKPDGKSKITLQLPLVLGNKSFEKLGKSIEQVMKERNHPGVVFNNGMLVLKHDVVVSLFKPVTDQIVEHIEKLMQDPAMKDCSYFMVVGGFGESAILQKAISDRFVPKVKMLIPEEAQMTVIKGAVLFGHKPDYYIQERKVRKTYGIYYEPPFEAKEHDPRYKYTTNDGEDRVKLFSVYVNKEDKVEVGKKIKNSFAARSGYDIRIQILEANKSNPVYAEEFGCNYLGEFIIKASTQEKGKDVAIDVEMAFGRTEMQITAKEQKTGVYAETTLNFL